MSWKWTPKMIRCADCGAETLATHNKTRFCSDCAKRRDKESRARSTERQMQKRMRKKPEEPDERDIHFCDPPENVQKCLNCDKPDELMPCPFCGGEIEERGGKCNYGKKTMTMDLECKDCGTIFKDCGTIFKFKSKWVVNPYQDAIDAWNRRVGEGEKG